MCSKRGDDSDDMVVMVMIVMIVEMVMLGDGGDDEEQEKETSGVQWDEIVVHEAGSETKGTQALCVLCLLFQVVVCVCSRFSGFRRRHFPVLFEPTSTATLTRPSESSSLVTSATLRLYE